jgi:glycosyltransferase involved in cell wall biosynthesis
MRLLLVTDDYWPNLDGGATFERRLAISLAERHQVRIWAPFPGNLPESDIEDGVAVCRFPSRVLRTNPRYRVSKFLPMAFFEQYCDFRPTVIHIHNFGWLGICALILARLTGVPVVTTNHMTDTQVSAHLRIPRPISEIAIVGFKIYLGWSLRRCQCVVAPTRYARSILQNLRLKPSPVVISNGVDVGFFAPGAPSSDQANMLQLIHLGRLDHDRDIRTLILATATALDRGADVKLTLVGQGNQKTDLERLVHRLSRSQPKLADRIQFTGAVSEQEKLCLLQASDVFVIASRKELQSIASLEAMACGLPLLASHSGALPELCIQGVTGWSFVAGDIISCSDRILDIQRAEARKLGRKARTFVEQYHNHNDTVASYELLLENLAESRR